MSKNSRARGVGVQPRLEVGRGSGAALARVGGLKPSVGLRSLVLGQPGRFHPPFDDQPLGALAVDLRPLLRGLRGVNRSR